MFRSMYIAATVLSLALGAETRTIDLIGPAAAPAQVRIDSKVPSVRASLSAARYRRANSISPGHNGSGWRF